MPAQTSYDIKPQIPILREGTLLKNKINLVGTNAIGIDENDDNHKYGSESVVIPAGSVCMFVEDWQFMGADKETPISAWVRCRILSGEQVIYYTLVCESRRTWNFETFRGKKRIIQKALDDTFEVLLHSAATGNKEERKHA